MIGIVILNYNTPNDVKICIDAIKRYTSKDYHIYIVDNASKDNSYEIFKETYSDCSDITLLASTENRGFSAGNNIGIEQALKDGAQYLAITNADIILQNDALSIMVDEIEKDVSVGVAAPSLSLPDYDGEGQFARNKLTWKNFLTEKTFFKHSKRMSKKYPRYIKENEEFEENFKFFGMVYGCCYVARRDFFLKAGLLDEDVFLFNEEDIMAYKLEELGYYTLIVPTAKAFHNHHNSIKKTSVANRIYHLRLSALIVLKKYAKVSWIKLFFVITAFNFVWLVNSIFKKDYRKLCGKYIKANCKLLKRKKEK